MPDLTEKIGLGTVQFGTDYGISNKIGKVSIEEVADIIDVFKIRGGRFLDTASAYGTAEEVLGRFDLSGFNIVSKWMPPVIGECVHDIFQDSLAKLKVDQLYGFLAHRPEYLLENPRAWEDLLQLKKEGRVKKVGFSLNRPNELSKLEKAGMIPDIIQVPFNYFDRRFNSVCRRFKEKGGEIHTRSAFLQGLFFVPSESLSSHFTSVKPALRVLQESGLNLAGELLGFALNNLWADTVVIGVESAEQLANNISSQESLKGLPHFDKSISDSILIPSNWNL